MELIVGLAVLVLFDIAAWRWGFNSIPIEEDLSRIAARLPRRAI